VGNVSPNKSGTCESGAAALGALLGADLDAIVGAWPRLSASRRRALAVLAADLAADADLDAIVGAVAPDTKSAEGPGSIGRNP